MCELSSVCLALHELVNSLRMNALEIGKLLGEIAPLFALFRNLYDPFARKCLERSSHALLLLNFLPDCVSLNSALSEQGIMLALVLILSLRLDFLYVSAFPVNLCLKSTLLQFEFANLLL